MPDFCHYYSEDGPCSAKALLSHLGNGRVIFMIDGDILFFFEGNTEALELFRVLSEKINGNIENVRVKVQKTQISFYNRRLFACVSLARVRRKAELPPVYITVTFGLGRLESSPRIAAASEPYPNRWTHHTVISSPEDIDDELMGWIREAADFSNAK